MKPDIHPIYHQTKVTCACGAAFEFGSTMESYSVDVCSKCHPFYTGKSKLIDTAGRVDKFKERMKMAGKLKSEESQRANAKKIKENVEEKITRKAGEKEAAKKALKEEKERVKKESAKKKAEKITVKPAKKTSVKIVKASAAKTSAKKAAIKSDKKTAKKSVKKK